MAAVSIVLPTYNRADFLSDAFASIAGQSFADWELIVVDDGSTDATKEVVDRFSASTAQSVNYQWQPNAGAGAARRSGIGRARGEFVAFFDSDDRWRSHHLTKCMDGFRRQPNVDWVFGAAETVDQNTGALVVANTFRGPEGVRPCLHLRFKQDGDLRVIDDPAEKCCALRHGSFGGLQASVFRRKVFDAIEYPVDRLGDDTAFGMSVSAMGFRAAYFDDVHVQRLLHDDHVSEVRQGLSFDKKLRINVQYAMAIERLEQMPGLTATERRVLRRHIAGIRFWQLGYAVFAVAGQYDDALREFSVGLVRDPLNLRMWKTFFVTKAKQLAHRHLSLGGPLCRS
jgi:glycosyltransferase involved in cell wall biosynthesis